MAILIAHPETPLRESLQSLIESDGHARVQGCGSAEELLKLLDAPTEGDDARPDAVLCAVTLPDLDGLECLRQIHARPLWRDLPVLMVLERSLGKEIEAVLRAGAADFVAQPLDGPVLLARLRQVLALKAERDRRKTREAELLQVTTRLQEVIASLQALSSMDPLTGLKNRRQFDEALDEEWRRCLRDKVPLSLLLLQLDSFEILQMRLGRTRCDEILKHLAVLFQELAGRASDHVSRLHNERFALLMPNTPASGTAFLAEKIRHGVQQQALALQEPGLTVSVGGSTVNPRAGLRPGFLQAAADEALVQALADGGDRCELNPLDEG
jgi:two-component system chemotaxis family response regulator WspR